MKVLKMKRIIGFNINIMKKRLKFIVYAFILIFLFANCKKENNGFTINEFSCESPQTKSSKTTLTPNISDRTFVIKWESNDQIKVYGSEETQGVFTNNNVYDDNDNQVAHFVGGPVTSPDYVAFYPSNISIDENTFTYSSNQEYRVQDEINGGYVYGFPMYAKESENNHLYFKNLSSLLILRLKIPNNVTIKNVYVSEPNDPSGNPLCGDYRVTANGSTYNNDPIVQPVNPQYKIKMDCTNPNISLEHNNNNIYKFYISIAPENHKWLLIGLNYRLNGSEHTTYQTIYAPSYDKSLFKFERSKWEILDVDFSDLDGSLIYSTNKVNLNPSGVGDTVINTGVPVCSNYSNCTFCIDITPSSFTGADANNYIRKTIYSEMDNVSSNWSGLIIRCAPSSQPNGSVYLEVQVGSSSIYTNNTNSLVLQPNTRYKFVITLNTSNNRLTLYYKTNNRIRTKTLTVNRSSWVAGENPNPQIGGDQYINQRYFKGIINKFAIYQTAWSQTQAENWINANN